MSITKQFDFFISYKVEDVRLARFIAEALSSAGASVWFDEYQSKAWSANDLDDTLRGAISASKWGLVLTGPQYITSSTCRKELQMLRESHSNQRILCLRMAGVELPPGLNRDLTVRVDGGPAAARRAAVEIVKRTTGLQINTDLPNGACGEQFFQDEYSNIPYSIDVSGWEPDMTSIHRSFGNCSFMMTLTMNDHPDATTASQLVDRAHDHRAYKAQALATADEFHESQRLMLLGVHLLPLREFLNQSFTWENRTGGLERAYVICLPKPSSRKVAMFTFFFSFNGSREQFWRYAWVMDDLVASFEWSMEQESRTQTLIHRSFTYVNLKRYDEAVCMLESVVETDPLYGYACNELSYIFGRKQSKLQEAEAWATKAVDNDPYNAKFANSMLSARVALLRSGEPSSAGPIDADSLLEEIDRCIANFSAYAPLHLTKAIVLALSGRPESEWMTELATARTKYRKSDEMGSGVVAGPGNVDSVIESRMQECRHIAGLADQKKWDRTIF